jgi:hypothetical protein
MEMAYAGLSFYSFGRILKDNTKEIMTKLFQFFWNKLRMVTVIFRKKLPIWLII